MTSSLLQGCRLGCRRVQPHAAHAARVDTIHVTSCHELTSFESGRARPRDLGRRRHEAVPTHREMWRDRGTTDDDGCTLPITLYEFRVVQ